MQTQETNNKGLTNTQEGDLLISSQLSASRALRGVDQPTISCTVAGDKDAPPAETKQMCSWPPLAHALLCVTPKSGGEAFAAWKTGLSESGRARQTQTRG